MSTPSMAAFGSGAIPTFGCERARPPSDPTEDPNAAICLKTASILPLQCGKSLRSRRFYRTFLQSLHVRCQQRGARRYRQDRLKTLRNSRRHMRDAYSAHVHREEFGCRMQRQEGSMNRIIYAAIVSIAALAVVVPTASAAASSQRGDGKPTKIKVTPPQWRGDGLSRSGDGRLMVEPAKQQAGAAKRFAFLKDYPTPASPACSAMTAAPNLEARAPAHVKSIVHKLAPQYDLDPRLVLAVIAVESNFRAAAVSPKNAQGLMQLIPDTAKRFGVQDPFNPSENIRGGMLYLRWLLKTFNGNISLALAGYNAGEKAVERHKGVPPYNETRQYVEKVHQLYGCSSSGVTKTKTASGLGLTKNAWPHVRESYDLWNAAQASVRPDGRCRLRLGRDADSRIAGGASAGGFAICR